MKNGTIYSKNSNHEEQFNLIPLNSVEDKQTLPQIYQTYHQKPSLELNHSQINNDPNLENNIHAYNSNHINHVNPQNNQNLNLSYSNNTNQDPTININNQKNENINSGKIHETTFEFRIGFIKKVYGILISQMLLTFLVTCLSFFDSVNKFFINNYWIIFIGAVIMIACLILMTCCKTYARKVPINYALLFGVTLGTSILLLTCCARYTIETVLIAWGFAIGMSLAITVYTFFAKVNFSTLFALGFIVFFAIIIFGIMCAIFRNNYLNLVYSLLGAILYGIFLICDTQLLMRGEHGHHYSTEDYIFASLNLYLDIIMIFLYILSAKKN